MVSVALLVWAIVMVAMSVLMWRRSRSECPNCGVLYVGSGQAAPTGEWVCSPDCVQGVVNGEASKRMWATTHKTATGRLREPPSFRNLPVPSQTSSDARGLSERAEGHGRAWLPVDYSQLELRMIASMWRPELLNSDSTQFDMHRAVTEAVYRSGDDE